MTNLLESKKVSNTKNYCIQFLPECLVNESTLKNVVHKDKKLKTSYLIDLVHNLILKYYFKKENSFNLSSLILKEKYGFMYNYYVSYLTTNNILILVKNYSKGNNSRIYKLNEEILEKNIIRFKNFDKIILKKYNKFNSWTESQSNGHKLINDKVKSKLIEDVHSVDIDYEKSVTYLDSHMEEIDIYQRNKYSIDSIRNKQFFYHFDNYGRFHTNFTILKSYIRKNYLLIDNEFTCEIDIQNSQPLFLSKLINTSIDFHQNDKDELALYNNLTFKGEFYSYLQNKFDIQDKRKVKEIIYRVFFGKNYPNKMDNNFKKLFPSIYEFIKFYKKQNKDYRYLSYSLQRLESNFLYNKVINQIYSEYPNIKLITCHDSIICKKTDYSIISEIFQKLFIKEFDYIHVNIEDFNI